MYKRISAVKLWAATLVLTIVLSMLAPLAQASSAIVRFDPAAPTLGVGQITYVSIRIDSVSGLAGAEVHLTYNPALLEVQDANFSQPGIQIASGSLFSSGFVAQNAVDPVYGKIDFSVVQLPPGAPVTGGGVLATITFRGLAVGASALSFSAVNLSDSNATPIGASLQNGQVIVSTSAPTPTPYYPTPVPYYPTPVPYYPTPVPYYPTPIPYYPTPVPSYPMPPQSNILGYHTVRAGETLYCIARAYSISPWAIASQNNLMYPYILWVGQVLAIPNTPWTNMTAGPVCQRQFDGYPPPPIPQPTSTPPPPMPPSPPANGTWYQVQYNDTLASIAARFGTTVQAIMQANNLTNYTIYVGQWLIIPPATYYPPTNGTWYQVQYYDTLESIAAKFGATVYAIMQANNLSSQYSIYMGQWLFIPTGYTYPTPAPYPPLPGPYPGEAWLGEYFDNIDVSGSPQVQRLDPAIDFDWGTGSPFPGQISKDYFSVRWTRNVYFDGGTYRLWAWVDDGVRIYVDGILVVNEWRDSHDKYFDDATLAPGTHSIKVEYYERGHDAMISVWWERLR